MVGHSRNLSLIFVQGLLWLVAFAGILAPLSTSFVGTTGQYWTYIGVRFVDGVLAAGAALLIKRRNRVGLFLIYALAVLAMLPSVLFQSTLPLIPMLVWAAIITLVLLNRREFGPQDAAA